MAHGVDFIMDLNVSGLPCSVLAKLQLNFA